MTLKNAGANCPKCSNKPAEYKMAGEAFTRWKCSCGASGELVRDTIQASPLKKVFKHWSSR